MNKRLFSLLLALTMLFLVFPKVPARASQPSISFSLSAKSAVLIDGDGDIILKKNADEKLGMASTTKIMTALTVAKLCELDDTVTVDKRAVGTEGSSVYLTEGETLTVEQLLYALLLQSANDAAVALAIHTAGSVEAFASLMNENAELMGLTSTHFVNPHGLYHADHYTTAYELALIAREALLDKRLAKIFSTYKTTIPHADSENERLLINHNKLVRIYDGAIGVKTGFTKKTGRTLVSAAERNGLRLIAVTLNSPDDWNDHIKMLDYGFESYSVVTLYKKGELVYSLPISNGKEDFAVLTNTQDIKMILPNEFDKPTVTVKTKTRLICAPVSKSSLLGEAEITANGKKASSPLAATSDISIKDSEKGFLGRIFAR